jgi:hypothetical protein
MSPLATLAIVAGVLLAAVLVVGVVTAARTRAMRDRDLTLAEALVGAETKSPSAHRARRLGQLSQDAAKHRELIEQATRSWERFTPQGQVSLVERAADRRREAPGEFISLINNLIRTGRRPHAGVLLLSAEPQTGVVPLLPGDEKYPQFEPTPADTVTWYRDQLLSLHPAYLEVRATLLERVTQLLTLIIRAEQDGEIPQRERYTLTPRDHG